MNDADDKKEAKLLTLYQELTGACEGEARSTLMFVESAPDRDDAPAIEPAPSHLATETKPEVPEKPVPNPPPTEAGRDSRPALSEPAV